MEVVIDSDIVPGLFVASIRNTVKIHLRRSYTGLQPPTRGFLRIITNALTTYKFLEDIGPLTDYMRDSR